MHGSDLFGCYWLCRLRRRLQEDEADEDGSEEEDGPGGEIVGTQPPVLDGGSDDDREAPIPFVELSVCVCRAHIDGTCEAPDVWGANYEGENSNREAQALVSAALNIRHKV